VKEFSINFTHTLRPPPPFFILSCLKKEEEKFCGNKFINNQTIRMTTTMRRKIVQNEIISCIINISKGTEERKNNYTLSSRRGRRTSYSLSKVVMDEKIYSSISIYPFTHSFIHGDERRMIRIAAGAFFLSPFCCSSH